MTATALRPGSKKQPKVYVVQEPLYKDNRTGEIRAKFCLDPARPFGDLLYVLNWSDPNDLTGAQMLWKIRRALTGITRQDYLLMIGNPTAMALVAIVACELTDGCLRLLYWDNVKAEYRVEEVDLHAQPL